MPNPALRAVTDELGEASLAHSRAVEKHCTALLKCDELSDDSPAIRTGTALARTSQGLGEAVAKLMLVLASIEADL